MNITIVAPYCSLPSEPYFNRFWYLAERLSQSHDVLLITSRFRHYDKSFRRHEDAAATSNGRLRVKLLDEPGYRKNVSLARVASHRVFVRNLARWLHSPQAAEQDIVYSAYPLMATNLLLGKHKARLGYKLIVDVQDVWPESFSSVVPFLKKVPHKLLPFASRANRAYRCADALVAVSQTYLDRAKEANPNVPGEAVYIGTDFAAIAPPPPRFRSKTTRLFYLGTLSYSYDVETVCKGVRKLLDDGENVELHIMGGGPDLEKLKQYENRAIKFYGYLPYSEMMSIAKGCDIAVNAIHSHAMQSITNKLSDYMALQKPILNSQVNDEVAEVLTLLPHANYRSGDVDGFVQAAKDILKRKSDPVQSDEIVRRFKRDVAYQKIVNLIERLAHE
ncbi:glucosaminyl-a1,3-N,N'-diacetylbacillosaminyl-a1-diphospho-di-trans,octa-cis-undecaprenol synthase PglH [Neisseria meningitidis]|uniref:glucosaminyl-a1,3-N, N'-diacetylbacillosaminyl-a1-diphospho-di-trans, octa-cis-undecaprenol synthase PglH n=1 Tax=Neisseria meningitidis TaxID=487 RepID=UPI001C5632E1|nr:glucosaminyl-a1,3-N,N'-diacetylbacillosaminyl-a1-diphospho-di-trans,octa-cis-undecaprenol synthase PglH [Neisseria meningitidis]MBW4005315.1 glucosaminyl-a1,3-N,N'-diacetylbacillosaminyl-a1-diphospho-di-trans,octa-cis-undecaprenol synthase PglH [Neisseria meningitidis]